jgi:hypothetical protein
VSAMAPKVDLKRYVPSKATIKERCTSIRAWELPKQDSALAPDYVWTNKVGYKQYCKSPELR